MLCQRSTCVDLFSTSACRRSCCVLPRVWAPPSGPHTRKAVCFVCSPQEAHGASPAALGKQALVNNKRKDTLSKMKLIFSAVFGGGDSYKRKTKFLKIHHGLRSPECKKRRRPQVDLRKLRNIRAIRKAFVTRTFAFCCFDNKYISPQCIVTLRNSQRKERVHTRERTHRLNCCIPWTTGDCSRIMLGGCMSFRRNVHHLSGGVSTPRLYSHTKRGSSSSSSNPATMPQLSRGYLAHAPASVKKRLSLGSPERRNSNPVFAFDF